MTYKMKITETDSEKCVLSCVCFSSVSFDADLSPRPVPKAKKKEEEVTEKGGGDTGQAKKKKNKKERIIFYI